MAAKKRTLRPGVPVRGSRTGRPVMVLLELLGRRWALRVLWELRRGPLTFRGLQERCDEISPTVLNSRLKELREVCIVESIPGSGYALTPEGVDLLDLAEPVDRWAKKWARRLEESDRGR